MLAVEKLWLVLLLRGGLYLLVVLLHLLPLYLGFLRVILSERRVAFDISVGDLDDVLDERPGLRVVLVEDNLKVPSVQYLERRDFFSFFSSSMALSIAYSFPKRPRTSQSPGMFPRFRRRDKNLRS